MIPLEMHAESFPPSGGMAADGMKKLLGAPALSVLETVIREAVQNSWDAALDGEQVEFHIALRFLTEDEREKMRSLVFAERPIAKSSSAPIRDFLRGDRSLVMELSDWGTRGLGGPSRADTVPADGEASDFVNFIRNVGAPRDTGQGGGTYGYGKSSLYVASRCSTVLIDTLSLKPSGTPLRRFIGCHLGAAFDASNKIRLTGRHWWGRWDEEDELVEPLTGAEAATMSSALGLPARMERQTGTTLTILDPEISDYALEDIVGQIQESLLWYLWPKMLDNGQGPPIEFVLEVEGERIAIPRPEEFPPLDLFIEAYRAIASESGDVEEIWCERPEKFLGYCAIRRGFRGGRILLTHEDDSIIPFQACHIALMRPVELVVKYIEGTALPGEEHEWGGVFICSDEDVVEQAFADSEPPAHDDWIPNRLPRGWEKTYVNVALNRLWQRAKTYAFPDVETDAPVSDQPSLARAADRIGELLPFRISGEKAVPTSGDNGRGQGGGRGGGQKSTKWRVSEPQFVELAEGASGIEAIFEIEVANAGSGELHVTASPAVVLDGSLVTEEESGVRVTLLGWEDAEGAALQEEPTLLAPPGETGVYRIRVAVPEETAVGLRVEVLPG